MPNRHNHSPVSAPELSPEAKAILDIQKLNEWRARQYEALNELPHDHRADFIGGIDANLNEYLESQGVMADDPAYPETYRVYRQASIDRIKDTEWSNRPSSRGVRAYDDRTQEEIFAERVADMRGNGSETEPDPTNPDNPNNDNPEEERRIERLEELKRAKHEAYVARMTGRRYGQKAQQNREAYDKAEAEYAAALEDDLRRQIDDLLVSDISDLQREEIIKELGEQYRQADSQEQYDLLMERGGMRARTLARYEKMSTAKKIGVGVLLAGAGAGLGFAAGAIGAGAAAIGGGLAAYRMGRSYVLAKSGIYREPTSSTDDVFIYNSDSDVSAERQIIETINAQSRYSIERSDEIKARAVKVGIGAAAIGGTLGLAGGALGAMIHSGDIPMPRGFSEFTNTDDGHRLGGYLQHLGGDIDTPTPAAPDSVPPGANPTDAGTPPERHLPVPPEGDESSEPLPLNERGPSPADSFDMDQEPSTNELEIPTYIVSDGEGWFTAFDNLGIEEANRLELLKEIGPELEEMGVAYPMEDGLWGISAPGELPPEAVELIMNSASENGWLVDAAPSAEVYDVSEPFAVEGGHGYTHELVEAAAAQGTDMTPQQAWDAHTAIVDAVGSDYIDLRNVSGADTYSMGASAYETGISAPSSDATWSAEAQPLIADALDDGVINGSIDGIESVDSSESDVSPKPELTDGAKSGAGHDSIDLTPEEQERFGEIASSVDMTDAERQAYIDQMTSIIEQRDFEALNNLDASELKLDELARELYQSNAEYTDGTPIVTLDPQGNYEFNKPESSDAAVGLTTLMTIDAHLGRVDVELQQAARELVGQS